MNLYLIIAAAVLTGCATHPAANVPCNRLAPFTQEFQSGPAPVPQIVNGLYIDQTGARPVVECLR